jgi:O-acetyl-ADP-ribose deacetylase (regulator of RNase III)
VQLVLCDVEADVVAAWAAAFRGCAGVEWHCGDLLSCDIDAVVSPANSQGIMDGGFDRDLIERFGQRLEDRVRELISFRPGEELEVGQAIVVPTNDAKITRVVVAPTMRMPGRVAGTNHAYLATWAALKRASEAQPPIARLGISGMGTGVGEMPPAECAEQMLRAWTEVLGPSL